MQKSSVKIIKATFDVIFQLTHSDKVCYSFPSEEHTSAELISYIRDLHSIVFDCASLADSVERAVRHIEQLNDEK